MEQKWTTEREYIDPIKELKWEEIEEGLSEAIAYRGNEGTYIRFLRLEAGFGTKKAKDQVLCHDFDEFVYIISGGIVNSRLGNRYQQGTFAVFPAGTKHGPNTAPIGALLIEFRHPVKRKKVDEITEGIEFIDPINQLKWEPSAHPEGTRNAIAYRDEYSGTYIRFLQCLPGFGEGKVMEVGEGSCCAHMEFTETLYLIRGGLYNSRLECRYPQGSVGVIPKGIAHGPMEAPVGCFMIEFRHYHE
jgi:hypothetical protein